MVNIFEEYESNVRSYCRVFNNTLKYAKNSTIYAEDGTNYIDFFAGAGALNYGHNNEFIKSRIIDYITSDGIIHGLDMYTVAKKEFIDSFVEMILKPRDLNYKFQFCGSTGTNAVEAALKLARKVKGRTGIFAFMGGFHGMSLGSLAATGNKECREGAGQTLPNVTFMPYPYGYMENIDSIEYIDNVLLDSNSGIERPAAIILETIQAEAGIVVAPEEWLRRLAALCEKHDILLICDDIQVGCGRTGDFFSFERAGIKPDMVTLSKSISGYGLPMSLLLLKPELDIWKPGEHNGTFRGNQLAFVGAKAAIEYRDLYCLGEKTRQKAKVIEEFLHNEIEQLDKKIHIRGYGMIWGIDFMEFDNLEITKKIVSNCFENGLIIERAGRMDTVVKILPPLTIELSTLNEGLNILRNSILQVL
ncbi:diaminobutyrate--2-oxoglutarate transaminase [Anaeromicropila populeti]|uniref:Diaminobutyrate--2-oxoglutarate transaminase n=1 Tax=Anaeromicropila populeti TaxID=37658 RepID=A0A1I6L3S5_9FIRM|nr:diaminobutyrate--2-oxoglutarate transaminase [Anaeromicropila populeti]SFR98082.1 diaminobutyrate aminotransferase apoenzyme [Anaeromicropila populeti]